MLWGIDPMILCAPWDEIISCSREFLRMFVRDKTDGPLCPLGPHYLLLKNYSHKIIQVSTQWNFVTLGMKIFLSTWDIQKTFQLITSMCCADTASTQQLNAVFQDNPIWLEDEDPKGFNQNKSLFNQNLYTN